jgi:hypothetical protein
MYALCSSEAMPDSGFPEEHTTTPPGRLERWGVTYFRVLSRGVTVVDVDGVHFLNADERAGLIRVVRSAVIRAAVAGAISTLVSAVAEVLATPLVDPNRPMLSMTIRFWAIVLGATALASIIEIAYLYWDGLRAVHRMALIAGLDLFGEIPASRRASESERSAVAEALARAALELPNPAGRVFGVNPRRSASRWQLFVASIVYKLKISVTSFVVKAVVRRALGRTALRGWLDFLVPFAAIPVTAAWNAIVAWLVLREARIRTMGPSAARELAARALEDPEGAEDLSPEARTTIVRAVASSIVRTQDLHPNLVALLARVTEALAVQPAEDLDDPERFLLALRRLSPPDQRRTLRMLSVAAVLDGRVTRSERRLLQEAFATCGKPANLAGVERLRRAFVRGDRIEPAMVHDLA